jgi:hypothetical protein
MKRANPFLGPYLFPWKVCPASTMTITNAKGVAPSGQCKG